LYQTIQLLNERNIERIILNISDVRNEINCGTIVEIIIPVNYNFEI